MSKKNAVFTLPLAYLGAALLTLALQPTTARADVPAAPPIANPPVVPIPVAPLAAPDAEDAADAADAADLSNAEPAVVSSTSDVSGVLVPEERSSGSPARALLVVPRTAVATVSAPFRGGLTLADEYHVRDRLMDVFFNEARTFGIYPIVAFETGLPSALGLRLVHKDVFGYGGRLRLGADYGGDTRHRLEGTLTSPAFAGGLLRAKLGGSWQRQPNAPFFGIGDQDLGQPDPTMTALPGRSPVAVATRFDQQVRHAELATEIDPSGPVFGAVSASYFDRSFNDTQLGDPSAPADLGRTDQRFDTTTLTGWGQGTRIGYSELQLGWDSLATADQFIPSGAPSTGTKIVVFAGLARDVGGGTKVAYTRYGANALRYFDLFNGDRVLILRGRLEGVAGADDQIPFTDLPRLGGPILLRGYARDRFRDRVSVLASMEYRYPIWRQLAGYLFVDGGRVLSGPTDAGRALLAPQHLRVSGGGGLEVLSSDRVRLRGQVAGSSEGFFFQLALEPVYRLPTHNHRI